jgi:CHAD domain-containing protein
MTSVANGVPGSPANRKSKTPVKPAKIHWDGDKNVAENASEKLPELAREFLEAGRQVTAADTPLKAVHRFRLMTKRFRYTLELFRPCYGPGLEQRIEALQMLQQYLGDINDCAATEALVLERDDVGKAERDRLVRHLKHLAATRVAKFHRYWRGEFAPPNRQRWWTEYLSRFASLRRK